MLTVYLGKVKVKVKAKSFSHVRLFVTPMDCSLPRSFVHGILQAKILEWIASSSPGDLLYLGIDPHLLHWQADSFTTEPPGKPLCIYMLYFVTPHSVIRELSYNHFILEGSVGNHIA